MAYVQQGPDQNSSKALIREASQLSDGGVGSKKCPNLFILPL